METVNHECYVSLETAKLLKQVGFDWECKTYYDTSIYLDETIVEDELRDYNFINGGIRFSAPTLSIAQKWLREEKFYNVLIDTGGYKNYEYFIDYHGVHTGQNYLFHEYNHDLICKTYESALEAGIKKCLTLILEKDANN